MRDDSYLLRACVQAMGSSLDVRDEDALRDWWRRERARTPVEPLLGRPDAAWEKDIDTHRAHRHAWYDLLAREVTVQEYAAFLLENWAYPSFLALVEKTLAVQPTDAGREAILQNIADEHVPVPHADLMRRLFLAVKSRAAREGSGVTLATYPSLIDRTLVFYYGYYCDPWHLVGSLYATEVMAHYRMLQMGRGLERLGFDENDREYIKIHLECDDDHARDWREGVIASSIAVSSAFRAPIAEGILSCLETSARYLDDLEARARSSRIAQNEEALRPVLREAP